MPTDENDTIELTIPDGEFNKDLGWVTNKSRVGVFKINNDGSYSIEHLGTGW